MAGVGGPTHNLPGAVLKLPKNAMCDNDGHEDRPAIYRIQGETDSFGCEYEAICQECYDAYMAEPDPMREGHCDWCKKESTNIVPIRDIDEGSCSPVYYVCEACRCKQQHDLEEELDRYKD